MMIDIASAYYRVLMHPDSVGAQALKVDHMWMVALALVFGKRWSGEVYPLLTAATIMMHRHMAPEDPSAGGLAEFKSVGYVDDFAAIEVVAGDRVWQNFKTLVLAVKVVSGHDAPATNKIAKNGFAAAVHVFLGQLVDSDNDEIMNTRKQALKLNALMAKPELQRPTRTFRLRCVDPSNMRVQRS